MSVSGCLQWAIWNIKLLLSCAAYWCPALILKGAGKQYILIKGRSTINLNITQQYFSKVCDMKKDLHKSGISDPKIISKLKLKQLDAPQTKKLTDKFSVPSYTIPYFDIAGKQIDYFRVKLLEKPKLFGGVESDQKYWQQPHTLPHAYFCPVVDWKKILIDTEFPIAITEGEKKAIKACISGIPTIGLGGVWSWKSKKEGLSFLPELEAIEWAGRKVELVFDNDVLSNPKVQHALISLSNELSKRGALIETVYLPESEIKIGFDDYLIENDVDSYLALPREEFQRATALHNLNNEIAVIDNPACYYHLPTGQAFNEPGKLLNLVYANLKHNEPVMVTNAQGEMSSQIKEVKTFKIWNEWKYRRVHSKLVYAPGQLEILPDDSLNLWRGYKTEPNNKVSAKPFFKLIDYLFTDVEGNIDKEARDWFIQWLAYPLQFPGTKLSTGVILHSVTQGLGKSFIGYIMRDIYGDNWGEIGNSEMHSDYNSWAFGKQFILGEEIVGSDKRSEASRIKSMITRPVVTVNNKYQAHYSIDDCINYLFTSNSCNAFFLEDTDRRFFVWEVVNDRADDDFYKEVDLWKRNNGAAGLFYHLLNNVDCSAFNPNAAPPLTASKEEMIASSKSELGLFAETLKRDPDSVLTVGTITQTRAVYTAQEITDIFNLNAVRKIDNAAMGRALTQAGFPKRTVRNGKAMLRLICVRDFQIFKQGKSKLWLDDFKSVFAVTPKTAKILSMNNAKRTREKVTTPHSD